MLNRIEMQVEQLEVPKEKAKQELEYLKVAIKKNVHMKKAAVVKDLMRTYGHLQHGGKLLDLGASMTKAGLKDNKPRLAIIRADAKICFCTLLTRSKSAVFSIQRNVDTARKTRKDIMLPPETFPELPEYLDWENKYIQCPVPLIQPKVLAEVVTRGLGSYYILWEVEEWKKVPAKDPMLLKKLTNNLFGILATWELTILERNILASHL